MQTVFTDHGPICATICKREKKNPHLFFFSFPSLSPHCNPKLNQKHCQRLLTEASVELGFMMGHNFWGMNLARPVYPSGVHPDNRQDSRGLASCSQPHQVVLHV